ncbi:hypothetical protein EDB83DRAFT_308040 [Lactarius deliciosus]|nr:hypothetical protein EDB83DRAFT_308040 [Lactarius deliciosus]
MLPCHIISHHTTSCHVASNSYNMTLACHGASSERDSFNCTDRQGALVGPSTSVMSAISRHRPDQPSPAISYVCIYKIGRFDPSMAWAPATGLGTAVHCSCCLRSQALPLIRYIHRAPSFWSDSGTTRSGARTGVWHWRRVRACATTLTHAHALALLRGARIRPKRGCNMPVHVRVEPWWESANARPETCSGGDPFGSVGRLVAVLLVISWRYTVITARRLLLSEDRRGGDVVLHDIHCRTAGKRDPKMDLDAQNKGSERRRKWKKEIPVS